MRYLPSEDSLSEGSLREDPTRERPARVEVRIAASAEAAVRAGVRRRLARLAALDAPQLAPLRGIGEHAEGFRLSFELPPGARDLARLRAERTLRPAELVGVALELCQALAALHAVGLAHGALDQEQVFVTRDGAILLAGATGGGDVAGEGAEM